MPTTVSAESYIRNKLLECPRFVKFKNTICKFGKEQRPRNKTKLKINLR